MQRTGNLQLVDIDRSDGLGRKQRQRVNADDDRRLERTATLLRHLEEHVGVPRQKQHAETAGPMQLAAVNRDVLGSSARIAGDYQAGGGGRAANSKRRPIPGPRTTSRSRAARWSSQSRNERTGCGVLSPYARGASRLLASWSALRIWVILISMRTAVHRCTIAETRGQLAPRPLWPRRIGAADDRPGTSIEPRGHRDA